MWYLKKLPKVNKKKLQNALPGFSQIAFLISVIDRKSYSKIKLCRYERPEKTFHLRKLNEILDTRISMSTLRNGVQNSIPAHTISLTVIKI